MKHLIIILAVTLNVAYGVQFAYLFVKIKKQMKGHVYTHNTFREIDKKEAKRYLGMTFLFFSNLIILLYSYYATNH